MEKSNNLVCFNYEETEKKLFALAVSERIYTKEECELQLKQMREIASTFYGLAQRIRPQHHAFIEFTGLMSKYADMFHATVVKDVDPNICNTHIGIPLFGVQLHDVKYLAEKLDCIFGTTLANPTLRKAFFEEMGWVFAEDRIEELEKEIVILKQQLSKES
jgi:hypothetical protein